MFWLPHNIGRSIGIVVVITCMYLTGFIYKLSQTQCVLVVNEENENENKPKYINEKNTEKSRIKPLIVKLIKYPICKHHFELIITVQSSVSHFRERLAIRNTWGKNPVDERNWRTFFLIALEENARDIQARIMKEADVYNDIVVGDVTEYIYQGHLTKLGFAWSIAHCNFQYLLNTNDDVFVNVLNLVHFLHREDTPQVKLYAGAVHFATHVRRSGNFALSKEEYKNAVFPKYCSGVGFVLSNDVVLQMFKEMGVVPPFKVFDAYIGELALTCGVNPLHNEKFEIHETCIYNHDTIIQLPLKNERCRKVFIAGSNMNYAE